MSEDCPSAYHSAVAACRSALAVYLIAAAGVLPVLSQSSAEPTQYQVEAVFLLNFTKFIEWPASAFASAASPISICILGDDPFGSTLDQVVTGETVSGRRVTVERLKKAPAAKQCQLVFTDTSNKEILTTLSRPDSGILMVGEGESFLRTGGMIAFIIENRRVRFIVNQGRAERAGLKLSSRLLSVAKSVDK